MDSVETLDPPLTLADVERPDGSSADPVALRNAFAVWRIRQRKPASLEELVATTNMRPEELKEIETLLLQKQQIIIEGPPGSGKTYIARWFGRYFTGNPLKGDADERLQIVQFHQSYSYEDFIEGIRPRTNESGQVEYHVEDGIFKRLCRRAADERNRDKRFILVIDEINRGNISRIFGELLLLLEYRENQMPVTLPYSGETFTIPSNIFLVGTMNTTDRSLAVIDYALRRRFYFYRLMPVRYGRAAVLDTWLAKQTIPVEERKRIVELFVALNLKVEQELGEHFQVGHSYLMTTDAATDEGRRRIWERAIMPLLEEYFYNWKDRASFLRAFDIDRLLSTAAPELPEGQVEGDGSGN